METRWRAEFQAFVDGLRHKYPGEILAVGAVYICTGDNVRDGHMAKLEIDIAGAVEIPPASIADAFQAAADIIGVEATPQRMKPWPKAN